MKTNEVDKYMPIDCSVHDELLEKATFSTICKIEYTTGENHQIISDTIKDVYTRKGEEFMLMCSGLIIRLDKIISLDGNRLPASNCFAIR